MRYGDMSAACLKKEFRLSNISNVIDPWTMTRLTAFANPHSRFFGAYGDNRRSSTLSAQQCATVRNSAPRYYLKRCRLPHCPLHA
nr:DUF3289 family protein [Mixta sp. Marseille-Q2659]